MEQKEEVGRLLSGRIIERKIEAKVKKSVANNLIKIIIGVRRSGKSVLSHRILVGKNYGYVNFDDERLLGVKAGDLNNFLEVLTEIEPDFDYLLLDEVQNVIGWELFVNRLKRQGYNIVVTGSNSKLLSKELATHLTGRHILTELFPFSFAEFLVYKNFQYTPKDFYLTKKKALISKLLVEYLKLGGFPEIYELTDKKGYLKSLHNRIISQDVVSRYNIKYISALKEIALYILSNFSGHFTCNKLKNIFEVKSVHTIKNYLNYLEEAYLIFQIYPFSYKFKNQIRGPRKIYGVDIGLIKAISTAVSPDAGKVMENVVLLELKRREMQEIYFFQDYQANEVDFVIKQGLKVKQLIQVCHDLSDLDAKKREVKSLLKASQETRCSNLLIINSDIGGEEKVKGKKIKYAPLWKWLLERSLT